MNNTHIQWCDYSANVIKYRDEDGKSVWACVKVSDGCKNCYSEALAKRYGRGGPFTVGATAKVTPYFDEAEAKALLSPKRLPAGSKVFIGDMTDVFGPWVPDELLDRLFAVFALRPDVVFQVLTKRPERMRAWMADLTTERLIETAREMLGDEAEVFVANWLNGWSRPRGVDDGNPCDGTVPRWPLANCWLGTSVEDQPRANERIPELLATPAAVRFLSCEPLLGPVTLDLDICDGCDTGSGVGHRPPISWVIVGGESGPGARACDIGWLRGLVGQCRAAGVAVFVKQLGARPMIANDIGADEWPGGVMPLAEAYTPRHQGEVAPLQLRDRKGGNPDEWPEDLKVREFPEVAR